MRYEVKLTPQAVGQIEKTTRYLAQTLLEPDIARAWADALQGEIGKLASLPSRYPLTAEEPWRSKGIRKMPVKNFLVYYLVDEDRQTVWITAVIYGRRDQISALLDRP